ncbi:MAG: YkgJ family cysteine cluster protein [Planctomycetota bacterium]|nr:MAG: YkgJ family cysteine cluster protein [Planctomycetota bacterium]
MTEVRPTPPGLPPLVLVDGLHIHSKCATCLPAKCCTYIAVQIDGPRRMEDFEDYLWFVAHEGVSLYVDGGRWYLQFETRCRKLGRNNLCSIYDNRPKVCVAYTPDNCDRDDPARYAREFRTYEELLAYARKRFPNFTTGGQRAAARRHKVATVRARRVVRPRRAPAGA